MDDTLKRIMDKKEAKDAAKKEKAAQHKEDVATGVKKLEVNRTPEGLYWVRFQGGGPLPEELKSKFTSIDKLRAIAERRYGEGILA